MKKNIVLLILLFLLQVPTISIAFSNETDQQALLAFQNLVTSPSHFLANNWTKNTSVCSWFGVTCSSKRQRVVALSLPNLQLQGTISLSLANLSFLRELNLGNNLFHGGIPYGLGHLPRLRVIDIQNNQLNGSIPVSIFQHRRVQVISLAFNEVSGEVWKGPWYVPELRVLDLTSNSLTGIIPPSIGNATKLMNFSLDGNRINGDIPMEIGNLSQLGFLSLVDNQLTGFIPATLFNISSLLSASLANNSLSGPLLLGEGNIVSNMNYLNIGYNQISGRIPSNICQLTELQALSISFNNITGDIPRNIGCLSKLEWLYIGDNPITGTIPTSLGNISALQYLYCGNNHIVGQIPPELGKLSNLRELNFDNNSNLIGPIPEAIFNISSLELITFSFNNLSGRIPTTTGLRLPNIKELHLAVNQLEGEIPLFITNASKLQKLSLAQNFLTGTIPNNLGNLRELRYLLLRNNQLTNEQGEHELSFFQSLADCRMLKYLDVSSNPLNGILPYSVGNLSSTIAHFEIEDAQINGLIPTSIGNISGLIILDFQGNNLTGNIPSGTAVAIKVLNLENEQVCKRFDTECEVMRNVRHRNLVPVITTCSSDYIRAFVLRYIPNGSLENWLYREESHLNLCQRVVIMLDVAVAIEYLHHGHNTPIVHCDLKPANVLLDEDMMARVGDFGISKILAVSKSMAHTETLGTLGYIAPEYGSEGIVSASSDVYSYGIMLMEVLAKRRPTDEEMFNENLDLRKWITQSFSGTMMDVVDANLFSEEEQITSKSEICITSMIELALDCTEEMPKSRITMKKVVKRLNKIKDTFLAR